jgi:hypothetical protein
MPANDDLSPEARRLLDRELREAVGDERADAAGGAAGDAGPRPRRGAAAELAAHRVALGVMLCILLAVGVILSLATGSWWLLVAALAVHALGTLAVVSGALQLTTQTEHVSPAVAARLEEEGVVDPDRALTELVEDAAGGPQGRGNERTVAAEDDPAAASSEQRRATTPSSEPSEPVPGPDRRGDGG